LIARVEFDHRGRFQAQGGRGRGLQQSEAWGQSEPITAVAGHSLLDTLWAKLGKSDQALRQEGFNQAHGFIQSALEAGGVGPIMKTYPKGKLRATDGRVDVEVRKGLAFVADPAKST
jgi:hypothetical protein